MRYTEFFYDTESMPGYDKLVLRGEAEGATWVHEIPVQAVADRMEMYGLESVEQALEYIGRAAHAPEVEDEYIVGVYGAHLEVAQSELATTLESEQRFAHPEQRQTLMLPMELPGGVRLSLTDRRSQALERLGMKAQVHTFTAARMLDSTRPVDLTVPAAAEGLDTSEEVVQSMVEAVHEHMETLDAWRVQTLVSRVPQLQPVLEQLNGKA